MIRKLLSNNTTIIDHFLSVTQSKTHKLLLSTDIVTDKSKYSSKGSQLLLGWDKHECPSQGLWSAEMHKRHSVALRLTLLAQLIYSCTFLCMSWQWWLWLDSANAQSHLSSHCSHTPEGQFWHAMTHLSLKLKQQVSGSISNEQMHMTSCNFHKQSALINIDKASLNLLAVNGFDTVLFNKDWLKAALETLESMSGLKAKFGQPTVGSQTKGLLYIEYRKKYIATSL